MTSAFRPQNPPKTCGNCGNSCGHRTKLYGCVYDYVPCLLHGAFEHETNLCSDWVKRTDENLEQRYEQLGQVANYMLGTLKELESKYPTIVNPLHSDGIVHFPGPSEVYQEQLEALGVMVDE